MMRQALRLYQLCDGNLDNPLPSLPKKALDLSLPQKKGSCAPSRG